MKTIFKIEDGREKFYQWDLNRRICVEDDSIKEVHFCNSYSTESLVVEVINGLASIPNILLQQDARISAFAFTGDYTRYAASFKVVSKAKPQDYVYTETEIKRWDKLEEQVLEALDNTGYYVPSVGDDGVLSWQRSKSSLPEASSAYIKGDKGDTYTITENDYQNIAKVTENNLSGRLDRTDRSLEYLWKKSKGIVYDTELVSGSASVVSIPSGAMEYAALRKLGGMSRRGRNLLNYDIWKTSKVANGTAIWENHGVTLTATMNDAYTRHLNDDASKCQVPVNVGDKITISWDDNSNTRGYVMLFPNGDAAKTVAVDNATTKRLDYVVPNGVSYITFRFGVKNAGDTIRYSNIMIQKSAATTDWEPYTDNLLDAPADEVRVANAAGDSTNTYPIPQAIRDLCPDYGIGVSADCYNYIDFATKQYHHVVGGYAFDGSESYLYHKQIGTCFRNIIRIDIKRKPGIGKTLFSSYDFYYNYSEDVKHYYVGKTNDSPSGMAELYVFDTFATLDECRTALIGAKLYFELATPEIIDLSAVWPDDFGILQVEAGGTVQYHYPQLDNGYELAVPTELEIMTNVGEVI